MGRVRLKEAVMTREEVNAVALCEELHAIARRLDEIRCDVENHSSSLYWLGKDLDQNGGDAPSIVFVLTEMDGVRAKLEEALGKLVSAREFLSYSIQETGSVLDAPDPHD